MFNAALKFTNALVEGKRLPTRDTKNAVNSIFQQQLCQTITYSHIPSGPSFQYDERSYDQISSQGRRIEMVPKNPGLCTPAYDGDTLSLLGLNFNVDALDVGHNISKRDRGRQD